MSKGGNSSIQATKVDANKYGQEFIDFQVKQIKKERELLKKITLIKQNPELQNQMYQQKLLEQMLGPEFKVNTRSAKNGIKNHNAYQTSSEDPYLSRNKVQHKNKSYLPNISQAGNQQQSNIVINENNKNLNSADQDQYQARSKLNMQINTDSQITLFPTEVQDQENNIKNLRSKSNNQLRIGKISFQKQNSSNQKSSNIYTSENQPSQLKSSLKGNKSFSYQNNNNSIMMDSPQKLLMKNQSKASIMSRNRALYFNKNHSQLNNSQMSNKQQYSTIQPEELPIINPEIQENKAKVRDILIKVLTMEGNKKLQTSDIKKEVAEYQQYLSNYRNYIEFKEYNHYAEKDEMFERLNTPVINNRGESIQRINSKANLIMNKYSKKELVRKRKQVRQDNNVRFNNHTTIDVMQRDQSLDGQGGGKSVNISPLKLLRLKYLNNKEQENPQQIQHQQEQQIYEKEIHKLSPEQSSRNIVNLISNNISLFSSRSKNNSLLISKNKSSSLNPVASRKAINYQSPQQKQENLQNIASEVKTLINEYVSDKMNVLRARRNILRKRQQTVKVYHDEMYSSTYWKENPYYGFRGFQEQISNLREDYHNDKLEVSCDVIRRTKQLRQRRIAL
eukprot:403354940